MANFNSDQFGRGRNIRLDPPAGKRASDPGVRRALAYGLLSFLPIVSLLAMWKGLLCLDPRREMGIFSRVLGAGVIVVGLAFTAAHVLVGFRGYEYYQCIQTGPEAAFIAARTGGPMAFGANFKGEITPPKPFFEVMEGRYGAFVSAERVHEEHDWMTWCEPPSTPRRYLLTFERGEINAEVAAALVLRPGPDWLESRLIRFEILDETRGNVVFPGTVEDVRVAVERDDATSGS